MPATAIAQGGAGTTHVVAGQTGRVLRVLGLSGALTAGGTVKLSSSGGTHDLTGAITLATGVPTNMPQAQEGYGETLSGEGIDLISTTGAFGGVLIWQSIPG